MYDYIPLKSRSSTNHGTTPAKVEQLRIETLCRYSVTVIELNYCPFLTSYFLLAPSTASVDQPGVLYVLARMPSSTLPTSVIIHDSPNDNSIAWLKGSPVASSEYPILHVALEVRLRTRVLIVMPISYGSTIKVTNGSALADDDAFFK